MPDRFSEPHHFATEHYRPKEDFPHLETEYTNLFYSCGVCNGKKGQYWPNPAQKKREEYIPNPCDHIMHKHLRSLPDGTVGHQSHTGEWTIECLDLNDPARVLKRSVHTLAKASFDSLRIEFVETIDECVAQEASASGAKRTKLQNDINTVQAKLDVLDSKLLYFQEGCNS